MALQHIVVVDDERFIYLDASEEYLTPDDALALGAGLIAEANEARRMGEQEKGKKL